MSSSLLDTFLAKLREKPNTHVAQVARNILSARAAARKSADDIAGAAGIELSRFGAIETGTGRPSGAELVAIAEALGVSLDRFFVGLE